MGELFFSFAGFISSRRERLCVGGGGVGFVVFWCLVSDIYEGGVVLLVSQVFSSCLCSRNYDAIQASGAEPAGGVKGDP